VAVAESPNGNEPGDGLTPFERFERLTKRLVSVPKAEVDELRKKQQAERRRATSRKRPST
jgi:hypothetical protein